MWQNEEGEGKEGDMRKVVWGRTFLILSYCMFIMHANRIQSVFPCLYDFMFIVCTGQMQPHFCHSIFQCL